MTFPVLTASFLKSSLDIHNIKNRLEKYFVNQNGLIKKYRQNGKVTYDQER